MFRGQRVKLGPLAHGSAETAGEAPVLAPGELHVTKRAVLVGTASGPVGLGQVQPHGKKAMPAPDWARGVRIETGERFDSEQQA
jgi:methionyl-tRNA formyltransferase